MKNECLWEVDIEFKILMQKVKSPLKQTTPLQICSAPFLNSPEAQGTLSYSFLFYLVRRYHVFLCNEKSNRLVKLGMFSYLHCASQEKRRT